LQIAALPDTRHFLPPFSSCSFNLSGAKLEQKIKKIKMEHATACSIFVKYVDIIKFGGEGGIRVAGYSRCNY
jgi:hypothetical protein